MYQIRPVETKTEWSQFIGLPWKIYKNDPNWVPPLRMAVRDVLDVNKNPFFRHAYMRPFLAWRDGEPVGRIVGIIDDVYNRFHKSSTAFFGFYESINDQTLAEELFEAAAVWARSRGMNSFIGPMNPSTNHECGLLVEGFEDPPQVMMPYNPEYYSKLFEKTGFIKAKDLLAYAIRTDAKFSDKLLAHSEKLKQNAAVTLRPIDMSRFDSEVTNILEIYNDAWESNWGFIPMDEVEFRHMAKEMKAVMDPKLLMIVEVQGRPAAFGLALPDVNQALKKIKNGRLCPMGIAKLLWFLKGPGRKKTINRCRVLTLGVKKDYQKLGLGPLIYPEYLKIAASLGYYKGGEASWILEDNIPMNRALEMMCGKRTKVYRLYSRSI